MEIVLIILSLLLAIVGILGAVYPIIPGAIVSYSSLVVFFFATNDKISVWGLIIWGIVVGIISLIDALMAPLITKRMGGSKSATKGSFIGVLVGSFFIPPFGMILGSFIGALVGEWIETNNLDSKAIKVAIGSFLGFILGTGLKLMVSIMILITLIIKLL